MPDIDIESEVPKIPPHSLPVVSEEMKSGKEKKKSRKGKKGKKIGKKTRKSKSKKKY